MIFSCVSINVTFINCFFSLIHIKQNNHSNKVLVRTPRSPSSVWDALTCGASSLAHTHTEVSELTNYHLTGLVPALGGGVEDGSTWAIICKALPIRVSRYRHTSFYHIRFTALHRFFFFFTKLKARPSKKRTRFMAILVLWWPVAWNPTLNISEVSLYYQPICFKTLRAGEAKIFTSCFGGFWSPGTEEVHKNSMILFYQYGC